MGEARRRRAGGPGAARCPRAQNPWRRAGRKDRAAAPLEAVGAGRIGKLSDMTPPGIRPGLRGEQRAIVKDSMITTHAGGALGGVLTTPSMIMLMEETAQEVTRPYLPADHTTVGFEIVVRHLAPALDRKSTRLNSSHLGISYAVFCL